VESHSQFFLEEIPGNPRINKLTVIYIYKADWNLLLKIFTAYKLNITACQQQTVSPEQAEGRPGHSAASTASQLLIHNETLFHQRKNCAIIYNDAKRCFDRIIETYVT
jgi:hypothetical protein